MPPVPNLGPRPTLLSTLALALTLTWPAAAQEEQHTASWNAPRALELVERARAGRQEVTRDSVLHTYQARARGFVQFFLDRPDTDARTLVKKDQIALEVYWRTPNDTKQRIVGLRDEEVLPTNIRYHLDHLTVVQDEFDDLIRLGDGDEVEAVLHPAAPGSDEVYDFNLTDSTTLTFGGVREPVRVYRVEVRPKAMDRPGFIGSLYLDRATAAIVRMNFTFTPASYVDPYLDYIRISLDNSLWMGRYWLPYRQEAELRRELPQLDFLAGSIIRGRFEIGDYVFNEPLPDVLFRTRTVSAVPEAQRRAFPFEEPLFTDEEAEDLAPSPTMEEIEAQAREIVAGQALSGLRPFRLFVPSVSEVFRYNRAEGLFLGAGMAFRPTATLALRVSGGWSLGRDRPTARVELTGAGTRERTGLAVEHEGLRDLGPVPGASGVINTVAALGGRDYLDPWYSTGVHVFHGMGEPDGPTLDVSLRIEQHESAGRVVEGSSGFRSVRSVEEDWLGSVALDGRMPLPLRGGSAGARWTVGRMAGRFWTALDGGVAWERLSPAAGWDLEAALDIGAAGPDAPAQTLFALGGRGTLPGHPYRRQTGNRYWLATARAGRGVAPPWLGAHLSAAAGRAWLAGPTRLPPDWPDADTRTRASVGVGLDLLWEVIHVDLARGLGDGGDWALVLAVSQRFHPWL